MNQTISKKKVTKSDPLHSERSEENVLHDSLLEDGLQDHIVTGTLLDGVKELLPETLTATQLADQLRTASYEVGDKKAERTEHSESMNRVLLSAEALGLFLDFSVEFDEESFETQLAAMEDRYRHLISDCSSYMESHNPWSKEGKVRKEKVDAIRRQAAEELQRLQMNAREAYRGMEPGDAMTWRDIMRENRTQKFENGKDGVEIGRAGGSTSEVVVIKQEEKKTFFKQSEQLPEGTLAASFKDFTESQAVLTERITLGSDEYANITEGEKASLLQKISRKQVVARSLSEYFSGHKKQDPYPLFCKLLESGLAGLEKAVKDYPGFKNTEFYQELMSHAEKYQTRADEVRAMQDKLALMEEGKDPETGMPHAYTQDELVEMRREIAKTHKQAVAEELGTSIGVVQDLVKPMHAAYIAEKAPKIRKDQELSSRNVAASRMAQFLDLDCIAGCSMAQIEVNGQKMKGVAMDGAPGQEMGGILQEQKTRKGKYSVNAARQMLDMQVLDVICGQTDRHFANYLAQMTIDGDNYTIDGITGIDNDMSFGVLTYDRIREGGGPGDLKGIEDKKGNFTLPGMSSALADRILAIEPVMLRYLFSDILDVPELAALTGRVEGVQSAIRKQRVREKEAREKAEKAKQKPPASVFLETEEEWQQMLDRVAEVQQKAGQKAEEEADKERRKGKNVKVDHTRIGVAAVTYLRPELLRA